MHLETLGATRGEARAARRWRRGSQGLLISGVALMAMGLGGCLAFTDRCWDVEPSAAQWAVVGFGGGLGAGGLWAGERSNGHLARAVELYGGALASPPPAVPGRSGAVRSAPGHPRIGLGLSVAF